MTNYPDTIVMDGEEKVILLYDLRGIARWAVFDGAVMVDPKYLEELFSLSVAN